MVIFEFKIRYWDDGTNETATRKGIVYGVDYYDAFKNLEREYGKGNIILINFLSEISTFPVLELGEGAKPPEYDTDLMFDYRTTKEVEN